MPNSTRETKFAGTTRAGRIIQGMTRALQRKRHAEATRLFKEGQSCGAIPSDDKLGQWMEESVEARARTLLYRAFAGTPCFFCKEGREECEQCEGAGHDGAGLACDACLCLGITRCEFCDGSGLVAIDFVPKPFVLPVITLRARNAVKRLNVLYKRKHLALKRSNCRNQVKRLGNVLLEANSQVGVLENTVVAVQQLEIPKNQDRQHAQKLILSVIRAAQRSTKFFCLVIKRMTDACHLVAESAVTALEKEAATSRASRYEVLTDSRDFTGTFMDHPFLMQATKDNVKK